MPATNLFRDQSYRQRAVAFALALAHNTSLEPDEEERALLRQFEAGEISIEELEDRLEAAVPRPSTAKPIALDFAPYRSSC